MRTVDVATEEPVATLFQFAGTPPRPVGTTLDRRTQEAAEQALAGVTFPAALATVAAAVASGGWRAPRLLTDKLQAPTTLLDPATAATLKELTAEVVRTGTGTAAAVPGQQIGGKTGTAEIGGPDPNRTHAWFIGYRGPSGPGSGQGGNLAFAVLAEGGGVGGRVAAPLAARFLAAAP